MDSARVPMLVGALAACHCTTSGETATFQVPKVVTIDDQGCQSIFQVTDDCRHPKVSADCKSGYCRIPAGCTVMGTPECQMARGLYDREIQVTLTHSFEIGQYEVSEGEWIETGIPVPAPDPIDRTCHETECPIGVLWAEAAAYANKRSELAGLPPCYTLSACQGSVGTGMKCEDTTSTTASVYECKGYRIPTESEFEYAARAGTRTPFYTGPMHRDPAQWDAHVCIPDPNADRVAWYCANAGPTRDEAKSHPRGQKEPNGWGLYDILGNFPEWASDKREDEIQQGGPFVDPGASFSKTTIDMPKRGGSFNESASGCTATKSPYSSAGYGFRLVRTLPKEGTR